MNKSINLHTKAACKLAGWDPEILKECGEASYRALRKYMSAFLILGLIWGTIGYLFADKYLGLESIFSKACVSSAFIAVVISIERFIILKIGKDKTTATMRVIIALLMATLGATIFDQMIFRNDLEVAMQNSRLEMERNIVNNRAEFIDKEIAKLNHDIDSISHALVPKYAEFSSKPIVQSVTKNRVKKVAGTDSTGKAIYGWEDHVDVVSVPNPIGNQIASGEETKKNFQIRIDTLSNQKNRLVQTVHAEVSSKPAGFLEELTVLFRDIIMEEPVAQAFYICLFLFMMSLEILVVTAKMGEKDCDYDLIVERQLNIKEAAMRRSQQELEDTLER